MVIRSSSAKEVERLVAELRDGSATAREAAIARLRVIGSRAIDRLAALARSAASDVARAAAIKALDGIDDPRTRTLVLELTAAESPAVAAAAVAGARRWIETDADVLDAVAAIALDAGRHQAVRATAIHTLTNLPRGLAEPVLERLRAEDPAMAARAAHGGRAPAFDDPADVREWLALRAASAPLSELHDAIVCMRERERDGPASARRVWQAVRGAAHLALARRGSRVALYELRETFDAASAALPADFAAAMSTLGDASCLEPLAKAWAAAEKDPWWRDRVAEAARTIVAREKLTSRNSFVKRVRVRHHEFLG